MASVGSTRRPALLALAVFLGLAIGAGAALLSERGPVQGARVPAAGAATATTLPDDFWTVVLASIQADRPASRADAEARVEALRDLGHEADLLDSSGYSSLRTGYLVVFSGRFDSEDAATRHQRELEATELPDGPSPYVRQVSR